MLTLPDQSNIASSTLLNGQLAELPAILDSLLTGIANTTSTPIGVEVEGWWVVRSHKVAGKGYVNTENGQIAFTGVILCTSTYYTKQLNP